MHHKTASIVRMLFHVHKQQKRPLENSKSLSVK